MRPNLTAARLANGLSQQALGEKVGLTKQAISSLECGRIDTTGKKWAKLANILNLTQEEIQYQPEKEGTES